MNYYINSILLIFMNMKKKRSQLSSKPFRMFRAYNSFCIMVSLMDERIHNLKKSSWMSLRELQRKNIIERKKKILKRLALKKIINLIENKTNNSILTTFSQLSNNTKRLRVQKILLNRKKKNIFFVLKQFIKEKKVKKNILILKLKSGFSSLHSLFHLKQFHHYSSAFSLLSLHRPTNSLPLPRTSRHSASRAKNSEKKQLENILSNQVLNIFI